MSEFCEGVGHDYTPRYQREYVIPKNDDWPIAMTGISGIAFFISILLGAVNGLMWVIAPTGAALALACIIYCAARFKKTYLFDICKRCGDKKVR